jgi:hypothetical protein
MSPIGPKRRAPFWRYVCCRRNLTTCIPAATVGQLIEPCLVDAQADPGERDASKRGAPGLSRLHREGAREGAGSLPRISAVGSEVTCASTPTSPRKRPQRPTHTPQSRQATRRAADDPQPRASGGSFEARVLRARRSEGQHRRSAQMISGWRPAVGLRGSPTREEPRTASLGTRTDQWDSFSQTKKFRGSGCTVTAAALVVQITVIESCGANKLHETHL